MTDTVDLLIQARFNAVANTNDDRDWNDVLARARDKDAPAARALRRTVFARRGPARVAVVVAVVVLAAVVTAVAFGWPRTLIDFFSSAPAPTKVKNWFAFDNVSSPPGMNPQAIPGQARKIMRLRFLDESSDQSNRLIWHTLYVAPRKGGGFCELWTKADGGCAPAKSPRTTAEARAAGPLGVSWFGNDYPRVVDGFVRVGATQTVEARFANRAKVKIPVSWVSAPINAGFFAYTIPAAHLHRADALRSVVALDANGKITGRESFAVMPANWPPKEVEQALPDGTRVWLPKDADLAKAREMFRFRALTDGSHVYGTHVFLWVIPLTHGGECYIDNQSEGCGPSIPVFGARLYGGLANGRDHVVFFAQTKPAVATVELRYQNGSTEQLTPSDGFVVHRITTAHLPLGTRIVAAIALNRSGKAIVRQTFQPQDPFHYPCKKSINLGHGLKKCP
jgi:hypothetical protein